MTDRPDFPFYADRPMRLGGRDWLILMVSLAIAFAALVLVPLNLFPFSPGAAVCRHSADRPAYGGRAALDQPVPQGRPAPDRPDGAVRRAASGGVNDHWPAAVADRDVQPQPDFHVAWRDDHSRTARVADLHHSAPDRRGTVRHPAFPRPAFRQISGPGVPSLSCFRINVFRASVVPV